MSSNPVEIEIEVPGGTTVHLNFGIGALENFCEENGVSDVTQLPQVFRGSDSIKKVREFILKCNEYYHEMNDLEKPTITFKDVTRWLDKTGGFKSPIIETVMNGLLKSLGLEPVSQDDQSNDQKEQEPAKN